MTTGYAFPPIITNFIRLRTVHIPNNKKYRPESSESSGLLVSSSLQLGLGSEGPGSMSGVSPEGRGISIGSLGVLIAVERHSPPIGACRTSGGIKLLTFSKVAASEMYRKVPKFSDARKLCCNLPKTQTKRPKLIKSLYCQNDANGIANSEDPDQTAPLGAV